jgi:hypothetical protein
MHSYNFKTLYIELKYTLLKVGAKICGIKIISILKG